MPSVIGYAIAKISPIKVPTAANQETMPNDRFSSVARTNALPLVSFGILIAA